MQGEVQIYMLPKGESKGTLYDAEFVYWACVDVRTLHNVHCDSYR
jgi:hypothetical protein